MWVARRFLSLVAVRGQYGGQSGLFHRPKNCPFPELCQVPVANFETLNILISFTSEPCKKDNRPLDACYTTEQRDVILQRLNNGTISELASVKLLRGRRLVNIEEYRTKNGPFKTLESVVNVPLIKRRSAVTVFNSILNPVKKERKVRTQLVKFIRLEVI